MSNKNKNRSNRLNPQERQNPAPIQDYDLTQSLNKMRQYSRHSKRSNQSDGTFSDDEQGQLKRRDYVSSNSSQFEGSTTGVPNWERYDRLEDRFTSFSDKNDKEHTALRKELEGKIEKSANDIKEDIRDLKQNLDKKLSIQWYSWTIVALVTMAGLFWILSYQDISKLPTEIMKLGNKIDQIEEEMKTEETLHNTSVMIRDTIKINNHQK